MASVEDVKKAQPGELKLIDIRKKPDEQQIPGSMRADGEALEGGYAAWQSAGLPTEKRRD